MITCEGSHIQTHVSRIHEECEEFDRTMRSLEESDETSLSNDVLQGAQEGQFSNKDESIVIERTRHPFGGNDMKYTFSTEGLIDGTQEQCAPGLQYRDGRECRNKDQRSREVFAYHTAHSCYY